MVVDTYDHVTRVIKRGSSNRHQQGSIRARWWWWDAVVGGGGGMQWWDVVVRVGGGSWKIVKNLFVYINYSKETLCAGLATNNP